MRLKSKPTYIYTQYEQVQTVYCILVEILWRVANKKSDGSNTVIAEDCCSDCSSCAFYKYIELSLECVDSLSLDYYSK